VARRLDCVAELRDVETILEHGPSYRRQRAVAAQHKGSLKAVMASLVAEMRDGIVKV
jgi:carboxylate-amine ligase